MDIRPGDRFTDIDGYEFLVVSGKGFNLKNDLGEEANLILIDEKTGNMEAFVEDWDDIEELYGVVYVDENPNSVARIGDK